MASISYVLLIWSRLGSWLPRFSMYFRFGLDLVYSGLDFNLYPTFLTPELVHDESATVVWLSYLRDMRNVLEIKRSDARRKLSLIILLEHLHKFCKTNSYFDSFRKKRKESVF